MGNSFKLVYGLFFFHFIVHCHGVSLSQQLEHISRRRYESEHGLVPKNSGRRADFNFDPHEVSAIIGVPAMPNHLPEAEPIMPGHTLIRPALGMLKSSLKFPHRDMENGAGVYGNWNNIGIRYDGRNERVLYSGFRRMPADYIMLAPSKQSKKFRARHSKPRKSNNKGNKAYLNKALHQLTEQRNLYANSRRISKATGKDDLHENQEDDDGIDSDLIDSDKSIEGIPIDKISKDAPITKNQWLTNSKYAYTNIKINQNAPDISEIMPPYDQNEQGKKWWFYNEVNKSYRMTSNLSTRANKLSLFVDYCYCLCYYI